MDIYTGDNGVAGMTHRTWSLPATVATPRPTHPAFAAHAATAAQRKRRANAAPTYAFVDRSFI